METERAIAWSCTRAAGKLAFRENAGLIGYEELDRVRFPSRHKTGQWNFRFIGWKRRVVGQTGRRGYLGTGWDEAIKRSGVYRISAI